MELCQNWIFTGVRGMAVKSRLAKLRGAYRRQKKDAAEGQRKRWARLSLEERAAYLKKLLQARTQKHDMKRGVGK